MIFMLPWESAKGFAGVPPTDDITASIVSIAFLFKFSFLFF